MILTHVEAGVGQLTLNRPEMMNAVTVSLAGALAEGLAALAETANVIVIRGAGGNFSAGGDFDEVARLRSQGADALRELFETFGHACASIARLPVPVIAAVEGYAMAGGFELMQACDIALVRSDARIADNHSNFAQIPGGGGSQRLPRLAGRQRALGHLLSGERLTGDQAVAWGLAYRSFPPPGFDAGVAEFATKLAAKDPDALRWIKRLVHDGSRLSLEDALKLELETVMQHIYSPSGGAVYESR